MYKNRSLCITYEIFCYDYRFIVSCCITRNIVWSNDRKSEGVTTYSTSHHMHKVWYPTPNRLDDNRSTLDHPSYRSPRQRTLERYSLSNETAAKCCNTCTCTRTCTCTCTSGMRRKEREREGEGGRKGREGPGERPHAELHTRTCAHSSLSAAALGMHNTRSAKRGVPSNYDNRTQGIHMYSMLHTCSLWFLLTQLKIMHQGPKFTTWHKGYAVYVGWEHHYRVYFWRKIGQF